MKKLFYYYFNCNNLQSLQLNILTLYYAIRTLIIRIKLDTTVYLYLITLITRLITFFLFFWPEYRHALSLAIGCIITINSVSCCPPRKIKYLYVILIKFKLRHDTSGTKHLQTVPFKYTTVSSPPQ